MVHLKPVKTKSHEGQNENHDYFVAMFCSQITTGSLPYTTLLEWGVLGLI